MGSVSAAGFSAMVSTTDLSAASNHGVEMSLLVPSGSLANGENFTFLVGEPLNSTTAFAVGVVGWQNGSTTQWQSEYVVWALQGVPGNLTVINRSGSLLPGSTLLLDFASVHGSWWTASVDGIAIQGVGGNGTLDLGTNVSVGLAPGSSPFAGPALAVVSSVPGPPVAVDLPVALGWLIPSVNGPLLQTPSMGIWNGPSAGWHVVGSDQAAGLLDGEVQIGGTLPNAPVPGAWLWGLGGAAIRPIANATTSPAGAYPNSGVGATLNLSAGGSVGPNATSYLVVAWEVPLAGTQVGVGAWVDAPGGRVVPLYEMNRSGTYTYVIDWRHPSFAPVLALRATAEANGWWNFSVNGAPILGTSDDDNGSLPVGSRSASGPTGPSLVVETASPPSVAPAVLDAAVLLNVSGAWVLPSRAVVGPLQPGCGTGCAGAPLQGAEQDPFLDPGQLLVGSSGGPLPVGTLLWNGTSLPAAQVASSTLPAPVGSFANLTLTLWVNGSAGPLPGGVVEVSGPAGLVLGTPSYPSVGVATVPLSSPQVLVYQQLLLTVLGSAPGFHRAVATVPVVLAPTPLVLQARFLGGGPVVSNSTTPLEVWANGTFGAGPQGAALLRGTSQLGGRILPLGFDPLRRAYQLDYTAPNTSFSVPDVISLFASAPGFTQGTLGLPLTVSPLALVLTASLTGGTVWSGGTFVVRVVVTDPTGTPIPGTSVTAAFGATGPPGPTPSPASGPGTYLLNVSVPLLPSNQTLTLSVVAAAPGYAPATQELPVPVLVRPVALSASVLPLGHGEFSVQMAVSSQGVPLAGASVVVSAPQGTVAPATLTTGSGGGGSFAWTAPSGGSGTYLVTVAVRAPGYEARNLTLAISLPPAASTLGLPDQDWLALAPALVLLGFALLWGVGRWRAGPPRDRLDHLPRDVPPSGARSGTTMSEEGAPAKGTAPPDGTSALPEQGAPTASWSNLDHEEGLPPPGPSKSAPEEPSATGADLEGPRGRGTGSVTPRSSSPRRRSARPKKAAPLEGTEDRPGPVGRSPKER